MEESVRAFAAIQFLVIGVSHVACPGEWRAFFELLRQHGAAGSFANAFLTLFTGALIVAFHDVWSGVPAVLTVVGWAFVLKSLVYLALPSVGLRGLERGARSGPHEIAAAGAGLIALGLVLGYTLVGG